MARLKRNNQFSPDQYAGPGPGTDYIRGAIRVRDHWGKLECVAVESVRIKWFMGADYAVTMYGHTWVKVLRCYGDENGGEGCLRQFNIFDGTDDTVELDEDFAGMHPKVKIFPGKKFMRHCGCMGEFPTPEEAGQEAGEDESGEESSRGCVMSVGLALPFWMFGEVKQMAEVNSDMVSTSYRKCLAAGLKSLEEGEGKVRLGPYITPRGSPRTNVSLRVLPSVWEKVIKLGKEGGRAPSAVAIALVAIGLERLRSTSNPEEVG